MAKARIIYAGSPDFAVPALETLVAAGHEVVAVLTQPDKPAGRGRQLRACPVKVAAEQHGLRVLQPQKLSESLIQAQLKALTPDLCVVAAYGQLLPPAVLAIPRRGCVNLHASLLPRWRGASPIQTALLAGDTETGISLMQMDAGLDTGPVFVREQLPINPDDTAGSVHDRLATLGGHMLARHLPAILGGALQAAPQDESKASYAKKIRSDDARLDWNRPAAELERQVRAYNPVPGARFDVGEETVKCWQAETVDVGGGPPGCVLAAGPEGIDVACGDGGLRLVRLQRPGRKPVSAAEFAAQVDLDQCRFA